MKQAEKQTKNVDSEDTRILGFVSSETLNTFKPPAASLNSLMLLMFLMFLLLLLLLMLLLLLPLLLLLLLLQERWTDGSIPVGCLEEGGRSRKTATAGMRAAARCSSHTSEAAEEGLGGSSPLRSCSSCCWGPGGPPCTRVSRDDLL